MDVIELRLKEFYCILCIKFYYCYILEYWNPVHILKLSCQYVVPLIIGCLYQFGNSCAELEKFGNTVINEIVIEFQTAIHAFTLTKVEPWCSGFENLGYEG